MRKYLVAAGLAGTLLAASPAIAGPGQCYDAYGRPVGPVYDTDRPNYGFINQVVRRGGSCTGVQATAPNRGYRGYDRYHNQYYNPYGYRQRGYYPNGYYDRYDGYEYSR